MVREEFNIFADELFKIKPVKRHITHEVRVGKVVMGGGHPIVVQSMALGGSNDIKKDAQEVVDLARAGSELVRIALNSDEAAKSVPYIRDELVKNGFDSKMIIGCGQYEVERLLRQYPECTSALGKIRINPGNVGFGDKRDEKFEQIIEYAIKYDMPVRIGVNWGSLDKYLAAKLMDDNASSSNPLSSDVVLRKALVMSAILSAKKAEEIGLPANKIVISCKVSKVPDLISVYSALATVSNYALHLGLTEAGLGIKGIVSVVAGLTPLLVNGIGDTIRASITQRPGEPRENEVRVCQEILQALNMKSFFPQVTACPGCNRTNGTYFQKLASDVDDYLQRRMPVWAKTSPGVENMNVAVMGCIVNGPGESKHANIGISLPGYGERPVAAVYVDGQKFCTLHGDDIFSQYVAIIENYVASKYTKHVESADA